MKVVHVSRFDGGTGAAIAVSRLHKGLLQLGIESMMFVAESRSAVPDAAVKQLCTRQRRHRAYGGLDLIRIGAFLSVGTDCRHDIVVGPAGLHGRVGEGG